MFRFPLLIVFVLSLNSVFAQSSKIDSLKNEIQYLKLKTQLDSLRRSSGQSPVAPNAVSQPQAPSTALPLDQEQFKKDFLYLQQDVNNIKYNLDACHKQYKNGLLTNLLGWGGFVLGYAYTGASISSGNAGGILTGFLIVLGGTISIYAGKIKMIDSHKYIGRAGDGNTFNSSSKYKSSGLQNTSRPRPISPTVPIYK